MWQGKIIELAEWSAFAAELRNELRVLGHSGFVAVRYFSLVTFDISADGDHGPEVNRWAIAMKTGTDRKSGDTFWNDPIHDHDHDADPRGMQADELIYANVVDPAPIPYEVHRGNTPEILDLTKGLTEHNGILVFDAAKLHRAAENEYWFRDSPKDTLLLAFRLT